VERRPFPGGGLGFLFAEFVIDPDEVGKKEPEKNGPHDYPEKIVIPRRSPVDCLVVHFPPPYSLGCPMGLKGFLTIVNFMS